MKSFIRSFRDPRKKANDSHGVATPGENHCSGAISRQVAAETAS